MMVMARAPLVGWATVWRDQFYWRRHLHTMVGALYSTGMSWVRLITSPSNKSGAATPRNASQGGMHAYRFGHTDDLNRAIHRKAIWSREMRLADRKVA